MCDQLSSLNLYILSDTYFENIVAIIGFPRRGVGQSKQFKEKYVTGKEVCEAA